MQLDQWLKEVYDEEMSKEAGDLEAQFAEMSAEEVLDIAMGKVAEASELKKRLTAIDSARRADPVQQKRLASTIRDAKKNPQNYMLRGDADRTKTASFQFMEKIARQVARQHVAVASGK